MSLSSVFTIATIDSMVEIRSFSNDSEFCIINNDETLENRVKGIKKKYIHMRMRLKLQSV